MHYREQATPRAPSLPREIYRVELISPNQMRALELRWPSSAERTREAYAAVSRQSRLAGRRIYSYVQSRILLADKHSNEIPTRAHTLIL